MGGLNPFKKPSVPKLTLPPAPKVPTAQEIRAEDDERARAILGRQGGRRQTMLTSRFTQGDDSSGGLATKRLLGG